MAEEASAPKEQSSAPPHNGAGDESTTAPVDAVETTPGEAVAASAASLPEAVAAPEAADPTAAVVASAGASASGPAPKEGADASAGEDPAGFRRLELVPGTELVFELGSEFTEEGRDPSGGPVWKAGEALVRTIMAKSPDLTGLRVLELASGEGIAGIGVALGGCEVVLTELPECLPLLERNVERNRPVVSAAGGTMRAKALDWRVKPGYEGAAQKCDFVLVADVVWSEDHCMPLVIWLAGYGKPVLLALSKRQNHQDMIAKLQMMWKVTGLVPQTVDVGDDGIDAWLVLLGVGGSSMEGLDFRSSQLWRTLKALVATTD